jgi:hypothetical protein
MNITSMNKLRTLAMADGVGDHGNAAHAMQASHHLGCRRSGGEGDRASRCNQCRGRAGNTALFLGESFHLVLE